MESVAAIKFLHAELSLAKSEAIVDSYKFLKDRHIK